MGQRYLVHLMVATSSECLREITEFKGYGRSIRQHTGTEHMQRRELNSRRNAALSTPSSCDIFFQYDGSDFEPLSAARLRGGSIDEQSVRPESRTMSSFFAFKSRRHNTLKRDMDIGMYQR